MSVALAEVTEDKNGDNQINTTMLTEHMMLPGEAMTSLKEQVDQLETELPAETEQGINDAEEEEEQA